MLIHEQIHSIYSIFFPVHFSWIPHNALCTHSLTFVDSAFLNTKSCVEAICPPVWMILIRDETMTEAAGASQPGEGISDAYPCSDLHSQLACACLGSGPRYNGACGRCRSTFRGCHSDSTNSDYQSGGTRKG